MPKTPEIRLEYRPCECTPYVQEQVITRDKDGLLQARAAKLGGTQTAHFDFIEVAAMRIREIVVDELENLSVHFQGLHVSAAWIDGVRFPSEGDL